MSGSWDRLSAAERERVRSVVLSDWLPTAVASSPHWSRRAAASGIEPAELRDARALSRLPPCRERDLLVAGGRGGAGLVLQPDERQAGIRGAGRLPAFLRSLGPGGDGGQRSPVTEYKPIHLHRGGASGELMIAYARSDLDRLHRCGARAARVLGLDTDSYLVSAVPPGPELAFWGTYHLALGTSMLALHPRGRGAGLAEVAASLALVPVTAVAAPVEQALELAVAVADADVACGDLATVVTVGPPPDGARREEIAAAWADAVGAPVAVRALWAPGEARALWAECAEGAHGLHTFPDLEVLELVDPVTGTATGEDGDLTYTSAGWNGTALLRYRTGVRATGLVDEPCPGCGRTVPRLVGPLRPGAWQPRVDTGGGPAVLDLRGAADVLEPDPRVDGWRVEITGGRRGDRVHVQLAGPAPDVVEQLSEELAEATGVWPTDVEEVGDPALVADEAQQVGGVFADLR